ncbi:ThiF family adenylyltransferase [Anaeromyxobacter sp. PSR-1]|uniref:ThiF family adenylyltransferase n=1 Tax=Anaeromyxobacter sp. PSR-1 TaxID=1300915 RepID=UPI0007507410|nr:ThiF family adenylyltransferase [Anaeromyxobacter sp. PSR-1]
MSPSPLARSPDLKRLRDEGYEVRIQSEHLVVSHVPYVNSKREVRFGSLISNLNVDTEGVAATPNTHVVHFDGEHPCTKDGVEIAQIKHQTGHHELAKGLVSAHSFSCKPPDGYPDYYAKMTRYIEIISAPARAIDPEATARTWVPVTEESADEGSVLHYVDTATSRAGIVAITEKLKPLKIGIIGLGGTGAYILDLVAKTPVREIHLFDGDEFLQHNAFRAPGAPSLEELRRKPLKTEYLKELYGRMHKKIVSHATYVDSSNVEHVLGLDFVFVCIDRGLVKESLYAQMEARGLSFIDVGMGVSAEGGALVGVVRTTLSTGVKRDHVKRRVPFVDGPDDDYASNIQIAELNMLNAALAVLKWKKLYGFYNDVEREHTSLFSINVNQLLSEDK